MIFCSRLADLTLEIVEGPGAGRQLRLDRPITIGRSTDTDLTVEDGEISHHHAKVTPTPDGGAIVEDLGSVNGTFINNNELHGPTGVEAGDELTVGVTVIKLRSDEQVAARPSALRAIPPAPAAGVRAPTYVNPEVLAAELGPQGQAHERQPKLEKYLDVRVRRRAQLAPLALLLLIAIALMIYFATR